MMTSSNGNIFRVTGHLCGEFTGHPVNSPHNDAELWCFFYLQLYKQLSKQSRRQWFEMPLRSLWHHCNVYGLRWKIKMSCSGIFKGFRNSCGKMKCSTPLPWGRIKTLKTEQNGQPFAQDIFKCNFFIENCCIVEPLWEGQESFTKVAKFGPFPRTILYKSCWFYPSWQATSFERPSSWLAFIEGFHCILIQTLLFLRVQLTISQHWFR